METIKDNIKFAKEFESTYLNTRDIKGLLEHCENNCTINVLQKEGIQKMASKLYHYSYVIKLK